MEDWQYKKIYYEFIRDYRKIDIPFNIEDKESIELLADFEKTIVPVQDNILELIKYVYKKAIKNAKSKE